MINLYKCSKIEHIKRGVDVWNGLILEKKIKSTDTLKRFEPRLCQLNALENFMKAVDDNDKFTIQMAPSSGKSYMSYMVVEKYNPGKIIVFIPTVKQIKIR